MDFPAVYCVAVLVLLGGAANARYLEQTSAQGTPVDYDANALRIEEDGVAVTEEAPLEPPPEPQEEEEDSCEDFPPASCIRHFSPLPGNLQRSPFALRSETEFLNICE